MVNPLYWVSDLVYAIVLIVILIHDKLLTAAPNKEERAFTLLLGWVIFFCIQDAFWGFAGGTLVRSDAVFFAASTLFHLSTVTTTFFWLYYILAYLSDRIRHPGWLLTVDAIVVAVQIGLVIANFFKPVIFTIQNGIYVTEVLRPLAFFNQYVVYLFISIMTAFLAYREKGERRNKYISVLAFCLAPVLSGGFQLVYPDGPFYTIGYFLGSIIIHIFVVSKDREELREIKLKMEHDTQLNEQTLLANTDELTGLKNRRCYEDDIRNYDPQDENDDLVYISMDVNELKIVNDGLGHAAGDELLKSAVSCMKQCLGSYGTVYRVGGDEFVAIVYADSEKLQLIVSDLEKTVLSWRGKTVDSLSLSYGCCRRDDSTRSIKDMAKIADENMYAAKAEYYRKKGIDRRGQSAAFNALCGLYTKILRINITEDSYSIISMDVSEKLPSMGFSDTISEWLKSFAQLGYVHPDDLDIYYSRTDLNNLRNYFRNNKKTMSFYYRRKYGSVFKNVIMELVPTEDYTHENQSLFLYVKEIDQ